MKIYNFQAPPVKISDRIICALSYLTMGLVGFIWLIIISIQRASFPKFLKYHIMQSIFFSIILYVLGIVIQIILNLTGIVPVIGPIITDGATILTLGLFNGVSIMQLIIAGIILYLGIGALMGKYSYFPWISDNIKQMV